MDGMIEQAVINLRVKQGLPLARYQQGTQNPPENNKQQRPQIKGDAK